MDITAESIIGSREYQEDRHVVIQIDNPKGALLAVMDGHGGDSVAEICREKIGELFQFADAQTAEDALRQLISNLHSHTARFREMGSTLSMALILEDCRKAVIAVLGDSPVVILDKAGQLHVGPNHNVRTNVSERNGAIERGGEYDDGYINIYTPGGIVGLQFSRALGDAEFGEIISHGPEIITVENPKWVLVGTDGLYDQDPRYTQIFLNQIKILANLNASARDLISWAETRNLNDNATAVVWHT